MDNYSEKVENISKLLQERTAVFPVRDESFERLNSGIQSFAKYLIADIDFDNYKHDASVVADAIKLADSPVFICGSMKSGTTLIAHLLDAHPDLLVMPGDSHFMNQMNNWQRGQFNEIASYWIHRIINPTGQEPFWFFDKSEEPFNIFLAYLWYFLKNTEKDVFVCVVMSFQAVNSIYYGLPARKYWVEKTPHNELYTQKLVQIFPQAKFIHILRNPLENIASLRKLDDYRGWQSSALSHARDIKTLFRAAQKNLEALGNESYLVVKYEELTSNPLGFLNKICMFLDISFEQTLLTPTENGKPAVSNSMFQSDRVKGRILNRGQNKRYLKELSQKELKNIVTELYSDALAAGYPWDDKDISQYRKTGLSYFFHFAKETLKGMLIKFPHVF